MARATSSLPTPLSPRISTVTSLSDTCSMTDAIVAISGLSPQKRNARSWSSLSWRRSSVISETSRVFSIALLIAESSAISPSPSGSSGLTT